MSFYLLIFVFGTNSFLLKLVADLITAAGPDRILFLDLHADQIQGFDVLFSFQPHPLSKNSNTNQSKVHCILCFSLLKFRVEFRIL
jgi:phosphoribosyl 1,2-cyclic phosphodiesterase